MANDLGIAGGLNLFLDASATMCLVNRRGLGKAKHVDMQNLWIQEASKSGRFVTKRVGTSVNPADLMTNETENRAAQEHHELRVCGTVFEAMRKTWKEIGGKFGEREREARVLGAAMACAGSSEAASSMMASW